jgi:sugar porter (SP) family MFS transporter
MLTAPVTGTDPRAEAHYNLGYIWMISLVAALGGLLFGYDWVVIGGAKQFFEPYFGINGNSELAWDSLVSGWANSCALVGCLIGSIAGGALSDRFGRKWLLSTAAILFVVTSIGNALAVHFATFIAWRILGGTAIGLASNLSPLYISEVAPAGMRGRLVAINQLTIVIGILLAQFINWWLGRNLPEGVTDEWIRNNAWFGQECWRWMFGLTAVPSILFFLGMFFVPESPRWLVKNGRHVPAQKILSRIGGESYAASAMSEIDATLVNETEKVRFRELLDPRMTRVLLLGITLAVFQQWCGINVIFNYAKDIFRDAGYDIADVLKNIAWTGSVNLVFTLLAFRFVDRSGRRPLMLFGAAGLAVIYVCLGAGYAFEVKGLPMLVLVLAAMGCYGMSLAPVTWVVISEIFPNRIRGAAVAVAVSALWIACFVLTCTFPLLKKALGPAGAFWLYAAICIAGFFYVLRRLPETKGKTLEEIEKELVD